jgi:hypothetical protein
VEHTAVLGELTRRYLCRDSIRPSDVPLFIVVQLAEAFGRNFFKSKAGPTCRAGGRSLDASFINASQKRSHFSRLGPERVIPMERAPVGGTR